MYCTKHDYIGASTIAPKESLVLFYCMYDDINMILLEATTSASRLILLLQREDPI